MQERYINPYTDFERAEIARFTADDQRQYEESIKAYRDIVNAINTAKKDAKEEGRAEGRAEVAKKLKQMGMSETDIANATGLTPNEIANL